MAVVQVPTIRMVVDDNPKGSATRHVTMKSDNPFERRAPVTRMANQPHDMLPGMGALWSGFAPDAPAPAPTYGVATPAVQAGTTTPTSSGWGGMFSSDLFSSLTKSVLDVGSTWAKSELADKPVDTGPSAQDLMTMMAMQQMGAPKAGALPTTQPIYLQAPQAQRLPVIAPPAPVAPKSNALLWVVGGIAAFALLGGGLLAAKRK